MLKIIMQNLIISLPDGCCAFVQNVSCDFMFLFSAVQHYYIKTIKTVKYKKLMEAA